MKTLFNILALGLLTFSTNAATSTNRGTAWSQYGATTTLSNTMITVFAVPGTTNLHIRFDDLAWNFATNIANITTILSYLEGDQSIAISSFSNNRNSVEKGSTVATVALSWAVTGLEPLGEFLTFDGETTSLDPSLRAYSYESPFTDNKTFSLQVTNGLLSATATTTVSFQQKRYWGAEAAETADDPTVLGFSSEFGTAKAVTKTVVCDGQYLYFCYPNSWGAATFIVNGLLNTDWNLTTRDFVNASGYSSSYNIYRSGNLLYGTYIVQIQ